MTVMELIQKLNSQDPNAEIIVFDTFNGYTTDIKSVEASAKEPQEETNFVYIMTR